MRYLEDDVHPDWTDEDYVNFATSDGRDLYWVKDFDLEKGVGTFIQLGNKENEIESKLTETQLETLTNADDEEIANMLFTFEVE